jgi:hypothetical protein
MFGRAFMVAVMASLISAVLVTGAQAVAVVCPAEAPGQVVTYQGPEPVQLEYVENVTYYYDWSAEVDGSTIASGSDRNFSFTTPDVTPDEGTKIVTITLLVTDGYGCIDETTDCLSVHALPACGIDGPVGVCEESPIKEFSYVGEDTTTADFTFVWTVEGTAVGTAEIVDIDWSPFDFGDHVLTLDVVKAYPDGTVVNSTCEYDVLYVESPTATFFLVR